MNKVALVTGRAGGIGRAVAVRLLKEARRVVLLDIAGDAGEKVADELLKEGATSYFSASTWRRRPEFGRSSKNSNRRTAASIFW